MSESAHMSDCCDHSIREAVIGFVTARYNELARKVVVRLQRIKATGVYGDDYSFRTVWDEFCHEQQEGPTELLTEAWYLTVNPIFDDVVKAIPSHEAALLTVSAVWNSDEPENADLGIRPDLIQARLEQTVAGLAGDRDMSRFR